MSSLSPLAATFNVALGGAAGAALRYQTGRALSGWIGPQTASAFPWATLTVNVIGSLVMGMLAGWLAQNGAGPTGTGQENAGSDYWRLLIGVGLLGGFTTFSSFSLELMMLIERGQWALSLAYALISVLAGIIGLYLGFIIMRLAA